MDVFKFRDGRAHVRNSEMNGLTRDLTKVELAVQRFGLFKEKVILLREVTVQNIWSKFEKGSLVLKWVHPKLNCALSWAFEHGSE